MEKMKGFFKRNSATILTSIGAVGVVATSVMAVKATPKATLLLKEAIEEKGESLTKFETIMAAGPAYIPAVVVGVSTIACIFGANILNKRKQASLMSAYALLDSSYKEYKKKIVEMLGEDAEQEIRHDIAKDHYNEDILPEDNKILFYDEESKRYFNSTMEDVITAEYNLNRTLSNDGYACLNNFYDELDIDPVPGGDEIGWTQGQMYEMYWSNWIEFVHEKIEMEDGLECYLIRIPFEPTSDYSDY